MSQISEIDALRMLGASLSRRLRSMIGALPEPSRWERYDRLRLQEVQDYHKGEDCFIVGNGPSLNKTDLERLNGKHVFGLNKIYLIFEKQKMDLSYLVACNPLVIEQSADVYRNMNTTLFLSRKPALAQNLNENHILHVRTGGEVSFAKKLSGEKSIYEGFTVTNVAIQIAYCMGFERVFLVGVDHSFKQAGNPNEKQYMEENDPNHFHPDYFKGNHWQLADLEGSELSYGIAKLYFKRAQRTLLDATIDGKLTVFPKIKFEEAVRMCADRQKEPICF